MKNRTTERPHKEDLKLLNEVGSGLVISNIMSENPLTKKLQIV